MVSIAVIQHHDESNLGRKGFVPSYTSMHLSTTHTGKLGQEQKQRLTFLPAFLHGLLRLLSHTA